MKYETVLITGGTSGIGYELAKLFASDGYHIVIVAQDTEKLSQTKTLLEETYHVSVNTFQKDLSKAISAQELFDTMQKSSIGINIVVNNAGYGDYGPFSETDWKKEEQMILLNMLTLTHVTKLFLPHMIERGNGRVLNVSSIAAFQPGPFMAVYYATKAYALSFSLALAEELQGTGVTVTALCPGITRTGFQERANMTGVKLFSPHVMDAKTVALVGYNGVMHGKKLVVPGVRNAFLTKSVRLISPSLAARIVKKLLKG